MIGVIGFGRFGQLIAKHVPVMVTDVVDRIDDAKQLGARWGTLEEVASCDVVVVAVPISAFESTIDSVKSLIRPGTLVIDVCSVKEHPLKVMSSLSDVETIGLHPLFGPDTAADGLSGLTVVVCPGKTSQLDQTVDFLKGLGLKVVITSAADHDKNMARSLALIHLLGRALISIGSDKVSLCTQTHERLLEIIEITRNDSEELFKDMHRYNRYAAESRKGLIDELERLDASLKDF